VALSAISSAANENLTIDAKGSGTINLGSASTGNIICSQIFKANSGNAASSNSNGAAIVNGGLGVSGSIYGNSSNTAQALIIGVSAPRASAVITVDHTGAATNAFNINNADTGSSGQATMIFQRNLAQVGSINTTNNSTSYVTSSDRRIKNDFRAISNATAVINEVRIYDHSWIKDPSSRAYGAIAQELILVVPTAVLPTDDGTSMKATDRNFQPWGVDYSKVVPLLIAAVQEADARIRALEAKLGISS
jgi:hypothetical protein